MSSLDGEDWIPRQRFVGSDDLLGQIHGLERGQDGSSGHGTPVDVGEMDVGSTCLVVSEAELAEDVTFPIRVAQADRLVHTI